MEKMFTVDDIYMTASEKEAVAECGSDIKEASECSDKSGAALVRPEWDDYFMEIAEVVSKRSTCLRRKVGALIVKNRRILATGYNGVPSGISHCADVGCLRMKYNIPSGQRHELCRGIHAEQNAIVQAAYLGVSIKDSTLYCTNQPCILCAKMLINAGIKRIVIKEGYPDEAAVGMLKEAGLNIEMIGEI